MTKSKAQLGAGDVEIELDGKTVTLTPSLQACQAISRAQGGVMSAMNAVGNYDVDALARVIAFGLDRGKELDTVAEEVWNTGMHNLVGPALRYLNIVSNGGRPRTKEDEEEKKANPPKR